MKKYILDTNIVSYIEIDSVKATTIKNKLRTLTDDDSVAVSIITLYEMIYGLNSASTPLQKEAIGKAINFIKEYLHIIPLDLKEVEIFGKLKIKYKNHTGINKTAIKKHNLDLLLASTAIAEDSIVVSNDKIFQIISQLEPKFVCENWVENV